MGQRRTVTPARHASDAQTGRSEAARPRVLTATLALAALPGTVRAHVTPATPETLWSSWSIDPWLVSGLLLAGTLYLVGARNVWQRAGYGRGVPYWRVAAYLAGLLAIAVATVSPLDALAGALFAAHMTQHLILMLVAAPLLVLGAPLVPLLWVMRPESRRRLAGVMKHSRFGNVAGALLSNAVFVLVLHAVTIWLWHLPGLYDAALRHRWLHVLEHATFLLTALMFWGIVIPVAGRRALAPGLGVLYVFLAAMQSSLLGVLLLLSGGVWYMAHEPHVANWGLTPLEDQQLAGAIMWIPAGAVYAVTALWLLGNWLGRLERDSRLAGQDAERL